MGPHHLEFRPLIKRRIETAVDDALSRLGKISFAWDQRIRRFFAAAVFLIGFLPSLAGAETETKRIERVKAAFVLNIVRFVSWPDKALESLGNQLPLCLYRSNPFGEAIETIEGKTVNGRSLRITLIDSLAQSHPCSIVLIGLNEMQHFDEESRQKLNSPLLTIADLTDAEAPSTHRHALVTLVRNGARIGFEINLAEVRRVGLQMSSNLLKLAKIVGDGT
jgi:hypothetical protein